LPKRSVKGDAQFFMKITNENVSRKLDSLGRISIPKAIRQRLGIEELAEVDFYTMEAEDGTQYICMTDGKASSNKYEQAAHVLNELGIDIPEGLMEKLEK
jgi:AbrB family looped-hinge helix DNA binding protein